MSNQLETKLEIQELLYRVGYLLDQREYAELGSVFAENIEFSNPGRLEVSGLAALQQAFAGIADPARNHSVTNVIVTVVDEDHATSVCKAVTLRSDGAIAAAQYSDELVRTADGWRVAVRNIRAL